MHMPRSSPVTAVQLMGYGLAFCGVMYYNWKKVCWRGGGRVETVWAGGPCVCVHRPCPCHCSGPEAVLAG